MKLQKINKAVVEMANNHTLGVDEDDIEELLEMVPEELTNKLLLELEQGHKAEEASAKDPAEESSPSPNPQKISEGFSRTFWETSRSSLKSLKAWTPNTKRF